MQRALVFVTALMLAMPVSYADKPDDKGRAHEQQQAAAEQRAAQAEQRAEQHAEQATEQAVRRVEQVAAQAEQKVAQQTAQAEQRAAHAEQRAEQAIQRAEVRAAHAAEQAQRAVEQRSAAAAARSEQATARAEAQQAHEERSLRTEQSGGTGRERRTRDARPSDHIQVAQARVQDLVQSLAALERARWHQNPHDTRGQGNLGRPAMQPPFGFDKESGREGQDRGRPIRTVIAPPLPPPVEPPPIEEPPVVEPPVAEEPPIVEELPVVEEPPVIEEAPIVEEPVVTQQPVTELANLAELVTVDFQIVDSFLSELQWIILNYESEIQYYENLLAYNQGLIASDPTQYAYLQSTTPAIQEQIDMVRSALDYSRSILTVYESGGMTYDKVSVYDSGVTIDYTVSAPEGFDGSTLLVTTRLTSLSNYDDVAWSAGQDGSDLPIHYEVGQIIVEDTQEVTFSEQSTFTMAYDPPETLVGDQFGWGYEGGYLAELSVTVTDPVTGASYTTTYDRNINLFRCPYGIVYDQQTGEPVAGATVTVHALDGSIIPLDKASNPNASNPQTTDATGRYNCKLAINKQYYLTVKAPGYAEYTSQIFSERWSIVREDVGLTRVMAEPSVTPLPSVMGELLAPATGSAGTAGALRKMP